MCVQNQSSKTISRQVDLRSPNIQKQSPDRLICGRQIFRRTLGMWICAFGKILDMCVQNQSSKTISRQVNLRSPNIPPDVRDVDMWILTVRIRAHHRHRSEGK
jgi:hypothetical protein